MKPRMNVDPGVPEDNPEQPATYRGNPRPTSIDDELNGGPKSLAKERAEAYGHDPRIEPQPVPPERYPVNRKIDANPDGKRDAESARERRERGVGGSALVVVLLAIVGLAVLGYLAFAWNQPSSTTVMNEQPTAAQQAPENGTGQFTQPAQPEQQPPPANNTTQP